MKISPISRTRIAGIIAGMLTLVLAAGVATPPRAHAAGFPVIDIVHQMKEWAIDTLAWQMGNLVIESLLKSTVNWINSGFDGSPAYVTDLKQNFRGLGDAVAGKFFQELQEGIMENYSLSFQDKVIDAVRLGYYLHTSPESFYTKYPSTLNQVSPDSRAFLEGDFSQGGFNAWFATVMNPSNNPYGAYDLAEKYLSQAVGTEVQLRTQELDWGKGFLSWRGDCQTTSGADEAVSLDKKEKCLGYEVKTPGSVIVEQLNNTMGESTVSRLVSADELNEVISALLNQIVKQVLGGNEGGGGLSGASRPSSSGSSFINRTTSVSQTGSAASNLVSTFRATVARQQREIAAFRSSWEKIRDAAVLASTRCPNASLSPASILSQANAALARAANAEAAIAEIESELDSALSTGPNQTESFMSLSTRYNELFSSGILIGPDERIEAENQAEDEPGTIYNEMAHCGTS